MYFFDRESMRIKILRQGTASKLAGFNSLVVDIAAVAVAPDGSVYFADMYEKLIYVIKDGKVSLFAGKSRGFTDGPLLRKIWGSHWNCRCS